MVLNQRRYSIFFFGAISCLFTNWAVADPDDGADRRPRNLDLVSGASIDQVDPRNGNLTIRHRDLFIPGNGGLDIEVWRNYDLNQVSAGLLATHNQSFRWTALGPGWSLGVAPLIYFENTYTLSNSSYDFQPQPLLQLCSTGTYLGNTWTTYLVTPQGEVSVPYGDGTNALFTESGWKITCTNNNLMVYSPKGTKYNYGDVTTQRRIGRYAVSPRDQMYVTSGTPMPIRLLTRSASYFVPINATDINGNRLDYTYKVFGNTITPWPLPGSYNGSGDLLNSGIDATTVENPSTLLTSISSTDGIAVNFEYDPQTGRLTSMYDNNGRFWSYEYLNPDALNSRALSKVTLPTGISWGYAYGPGEWQRTPSLSAMPAPMSPLNSSTVAARKITQITYPNGGTISYEYDYYSLSTVINSNAPVYIGGERIKKRTLSNGETWSYAYTRGGTSQYDTTQVTGPDGTTAYKFMGPGYSIWTGGYPYPWQNNAWRVGRLMQKTDPTGSVETYTWQARQVANTWNRISDLGNINDEKIWAADLQQRTIVRDGATYTTTYSNYDSFGNPGTIVESGPNGGSRTTTRTYLNDTTKWIIGKLKDESFTGSSTTRNFDSNAQLLSITQDGVATSFTYDTQGNVASKTLPRGLEHRYSDYKRGIPRTEVQPEGITLTRIVSDAGDVTSITNGEGKTTSFGYDGLNRVTSIVYPIGNAKSISYSSGTMTATRGNLVEETHYDGFGYPSSVTLGGISTSFTYDGRGRKIFESLPGASTGTTYQYDALNRIVKVVNADNSYQSYNYGAASTTITDERGKATTYTFRSYGDPNQQFLMSVTAPEPAANMSFARNTRDLVTSITQAGVSRIYGYNTNYYLTSVTNPETGITTYGRDAAGNMTSRTVGTSGSTIYVYDNQNRLKTATFPGITPAITYFYNKVNKIASATSSSGSRGFGYDNNGNLISEQLVVDGISFNSSYEYNGNDQLTSTTYPYSGLVVNYVPDVLGRPTQASGFVSSILYWPSGQIKQISYANGTVSYYDQNARLWPSSFKTQKTGGAVYINSIYGYDFAGNLTTVNDIADSSYNRSMEYDAINRLTVSNGPWGTGSISYDGKGNLTNQTLGTSALSYNYDTTNRLQSVSGLRSTTFGYDAYGSVINAWGSAYTYDGVPNLRCIDCTTGNKIEYTYDQSNYRSTVTKSGVKSYEFYNSNGNQLIEFTPSQSNKTVEYIYIGGKRVAQRVSP